MTTFAVGSPPSAKTAGRRAPKRRARPSPYPPQEYQPPAPKRAPILLFQLPPNGVPPVLDESALFTDKAAMNLDTGLVRLDRMVFGEDNTPVDPLRPGHAFVIRLYGGAPLAALREKEGSRFYGNELYHPQTGARFVLRILCGEQLVDFKRRARALGIPIRANPDEDENASPSAAQNLADVPAAGPVHTAVSAENCSAPESPPEPDMHVDAQAPAQGAQGIAEEPAAGSVQDAARAESTPPSTPELEMHDDSQGSTPSTSGQTTPQSIPHTTSDAPDSIFHDYDWSEAFPLNRPGFLELPSEIMLPDDCGSWLDDVPGSLTPTQTCY